MPLCRNDHNNNYYKRFLTHLATNSIFNMLGGINVLEKTEWEIKNGPSRDTSNRLGTQDTERRQRKQ